MDNLSFLKHNFGQRISYDEVLTRLGELELENKKSIIRSMISEHSTIIRNGNFVLTSGLGFKIEANTVCVQKIDATNAYPIIQSEEVILAVDAGQGSIRYDLVEARFAKNIDRQKSVDIIDPATGTITPSSYYTNYKTELEVQVKKGTAGAGVCPALTSAVAGTVIGTIVISGTLDLSTNYNLKITLDTETTYIVDCRGGTPSATTIAEIISAINTAFGVTIAYNDGSDHLKLMSNTTGTNSKIKLTPPTANDALTEIIGLTESANYIYEYVGEEGYFKLGEIRVPISASSLASDDLRDIDRKSEWTVSSDTFRMNDLYNHINQDPIDHPDDSITEVKLDTLVRTKLNSGAFSDYTHDNGIFYDYANQFNLKLKNGTGGVPALGEDAWRINSGAGLLAQLQYKDDNDQEGIFQFTPTDGVRTNTLDTRIQVGKTKGASDPDGDFEYVDFGGGVIQQLQCYFDPTSMNTGVADGQGAGFAAYALAQIYQHGVSGESIEIWSVDGLTQYTISYNGADTGDFDITLATGIIEKIAGGGVPNKIQIKYTYSLARYDLLEIDNAAVVHILEGTYNSSAVAQIPSVTAGRQGLWICSIPIKSTGMSMDTDIYKDIREWAASLPGIMADSPRGATWIDYTYNGADELTKEEHRNRTSDGAIFMTKNYYYSRLELTGMTWTESTKRLSKTGAFTNYTWQSGDRIRINGGTGANTGVYIISSKVDSNTIELSTSIGAAADGQTNISCTGDGDIAQIENVGPLHTYIQTFIFDANENLIDIKVEQTA